MRRLFIFFAAFVAGACSAAPPTPPPVPAHAPSAHTPPPAPRWTSVNLDGDVLIASVEPSRELVWSVTLRSFPPSNPSATGDGQRYLAVAADRSVVLTGTNDGSLLALDADGKPLFQLGLRGAVTSLDARPDGNFLVNGLILDRRGILHESSVSSDMPTRSTFAYRVERVATPEYASSVVAYGPSDVWALNASLHHYDGRTWEDLGKAPFSIHKNMPYPDRGRPRRADFLAQTLSRAPDGRLLVLGQWGIGDDERFEALASCALERVDGRFRERIELTQPANMQSFNQQPVHAVSARGREVFCVRDVCVELGSGPRRVTPYGGGPVVFAGETLWRGAGKLWRENEVIPAPDPIGSIWASGENDVWAVGNTEHQQHPKGPGALTHWDGHKQEIIRSPIGKVRTGWSITPNDVWLVGEGGAAHFDGKHWSRVVGVLPIASDFLQGPVPVLTGGGADVWIGGSSGLLHLTPDPAVQPDLEGRPAPTPPAVLPSRALQVGDIDPSYRLERVSIPVDGGPPLSGALGVAEGTDGVVWLHDQHRVVEFDGQRGRVLQNVDRFACLHCLAPARAGEGTLLTSSIFQVTGGQVTPDREMLPALLSLSRSPSALWFVSAGSDDSLPHAVIRNDRGLRLVTGLPGAAYADIAARSDDDAWMVGGLAADEEGHQHTTFRRLWPAGEGIAVHFDGQAFTWHRGPDGALLSVAAVGLGEAWAVGVGGGTVHMKGGTAEAFHVQRTDGKRLDVILRSVSAAAPDDVWMTGAGSTLLRWDGKALRRIDTTLVGRDATLTTVIAPRGKPGWVVGPSGIWRVVRIPR